MSDQKIESVETLRVSVEDQRALLNRVNHLERRVTELQQTLTLKEELLRAHRRHVFALSVEDRRALDADIVETEASVQKRYGR